MPRVKIDYVVSFSSESPEAPANNLLSAEAGRGRWLCARGEPSCSVLLQLSRAVQISSISIGAHLAALVEILVGRSETPNDPYQVLVASSVFLSPIESRRATEGDSAADKVRTFSTDQLAADVQTKRWDRVRVVCSQPYNKHCKYGISFIHIFSPEGDAKESEPNPVATKAALKDMSGAKPALKLSLDISPQDSDDDEFKPGALFAQHRAAAQSQEGASNTDSQIRKATSQAIKNVFDSSTKIVRTPISKPKGGSTSTDQPSDRTRDKLMYTDDDAGPHDKIDRLVAAHKDQQAKTAEKEKANKDKERHHKDREKTSIDKSESDTTLSPKHKKDTKDEGTHKTPKDKNKDRSKEDTTKDRSEDKRKEIHSSHKDRSRTKERDKTPQPSKRDRSSNKQGKDEERSSKKLKVSNEEDTVLYAGPVSDQPSTLLSDVVFVLSGYENPRRAAVRSAALAMGARYERDWAAHCTHLICAFPNTPKLKTVRSSPNGNQAVVVTAEWIERQAERCRRLPWQWFATEHNLKVKRKRGASGEDPPGTSGQTASDSDIEQEPGNSRQSSKDSRTNEKQHESECDTDDEIDRVMRQNSQKRDRIEEESPSKRRKSDEGLANTSRESDVAFVVDERIQGNVTVSDSDDEATDKEDVEDTPEPHTIKELPSFFEGRTFAVAATVEPALDETLVRRYVRAYGGEIVEPYDDEEEVEVDYVLCLSKGTEGVRARGQMVRGDWVWKCHEQGQLCPTEEFVL